MSDAFYTVRTDIEKIRGVHRRIRLPSGQAFDVGVHGAIRQHYGLEAEPELPLPVDYLVGAGGA